MQSAPVRLRLGYHQARLQRCDEARAALLAGCQWGVFGEPGEIAEVILFLATSEGQFIPGPQPGRRRRIHKSLIPAPPRQPPIGIASGASGTRMDWNDMLIPNRCRDRN